MKRVRFALVVTVCLVGLAALPAGAQDTTPGYTVEALHMIPFVTTIVWAPDGRMFFTDKSGGVHVVSSDGVLQEPPVVEVKVRQQNEDGLQSIALDPHFDENHYFYIYYTEYGEEMPYTNVMVRYTERDGVGSEPLELLRFSVESELYAHNGGRLLFGQDGYLYISIGDLEHWPGRAQDPGYLEGKIHRYAIINDMLQPALNNPFGSSSAYAIGLRNVFAFMFDPISGAIFATVNGPDCDDALLRIDPGQNFGWGMESPDAANYANYCDNPNRRAGAAPFLIDYAPTIAPTGILIYDGDAFPEWRGDLFFCAFKTGKMQRVSLNAERTALAGEPQDVATDPQPNCFIEVAEGPDGNIYYSGLLGIYRIAPEG
jgi:glucose/arabinose dehydrogenase